MPARPIRGHRAATAPVPLYWYRRGVERHNFGDKVSPLIVQALSGRPVVYRETSPRLLAAGSILSSARRGDQIWGTGFMCPDDHCPTDLRVHAVRGPLTRRRLLALGIDAPPTYGDPALLLPLLVDTDPAPGAYVGILPHHVDAARIRGQFTDSAFRVIDVLAPVREVIKGVQGCSVLLSSSLHGCILGDAYGIPTAWVQLSDRVLGAAFKFRDHFAATDRDPVYVDWRRCIDIDRAVTITLRAPRPRFDVAALLSSFPILRYDLRDLEDLARGGVRLPDMAVT